MRRVVNIMLALGAALMVYSAFSGPSTFRPFGLVMAINVFTGAALAVGSFTVASAVCVFGLGHMRQLVRPALLIGFVVQCFVLLALLYGAGLHTGVWRSAAGSQYYSALIWTAWCALAYTLVVFAELMPDIAKGRERLTHLVEHIKPPLVVLAAALGAVYQSRLVTLHIAPHGMSPLWHSSMLPAETFLSAAAAGLAFVVLESYASDRACRRLFDIDYIRGIGWAMSGLLAAYIALRLGGVFMSGSLTCAPGGACAASGVAWYVVEMGVGFLLPAFMLLSGYVRNHRRGLVWASLFVVLGVLMNRVGFTIAGWQYSPSALEWCATSVFALAAATVYWRVSGRLIQDVAPYGPESHRRLRREERAD